jgi:hypothetical protein
MGSFVIVGRDRAGHLPPSYFSARLPTSDEEDALKTEQLPGRSRKRNSIAAFATILVAAVLAAGCVGGERAAQSQPAEDEAGNEASSVERKAGGTAGEGEAVEADTKDGGDEARAREVRLRIGGDSGTTFSGKCVAGDDEEEVSGEVPQSFTYQLDGGKLECEITNKGPGALEVTLRSGDDRSVHRTNATDAVISLTHSENGVSSSTTSSSSGSVNQQSSSSVSSNSINQQSSNSIVSSSSSVNQQSSSSQSSSSQSSR